MQLSALSVCEDYMARMFFMFNAEEVFLNYCLAECQSGIEI